MTNFACGLCNLQKAGSELKLKKLEILDENMCSESPNNEHIQLLTKCATNQLKYLEELHMELSYQLNCTILLELLGKLGKCLNVLKLRRFPLPQFSSIQFNDLLLPNVTCLEMSDELVDSLDFLPNFPALVTLRIILRDYSSLRTTPIFQNTNRDNPPIHEGLKILFIEQPLESEDCISRICQLFPKLNKLKLRMDNFMLQELCRYGSEYLENLHIISWDGLTDQGFTGVSDSLMRNVGRLDDLTKFRNQSYIGLLKSLKNLTVEIWPDYSNHVSDASIYFGFLDLPMLTSFQGIRTRITSGAAKRFTTLVNWTLED